MSTTESNPKLNSDDVSEIDELGQIFQKLKNELAKIIVGQDDVIEHLSSRHFVACQKRTKF